MSNIGDLEGDNPSIERPMESISSADSAETEKNFGTKVDIAKQQLNYAVKAIELAPFGIGTKVLNFMGDAYRTNSVEMGKHAPEIFKNFGKVADFCLELPVAKQTFGLLFDAAIDIMNNVAGYTEDTKPERAVVLAGAMYKQYKYVEDTANFARSKIDQVREQFNKFTSPQPQSQLQTMMVPA